MAVGDEKGEFAEGGLDADAAIGVAGAADFDAGSVRVVLHHLAM
jgi:hypothetical protein